MFVIKDPDTFATQVIPQYFDHNKFSSFARQVRADGRQWSNRLIHVARMSLFSCTASLFLSTQPCDLQLNFYGFRKMQSKPIRNSDFDAQTAKHVTFFNENFKRGRCDLLKNIQRSTRGGGSSNPQDQQREVQNLREQVATLEQKVEDMSAEMEERMRRLELDMLARMEQMMLAMQQQQQTQLQFQSASSVGTLPNNRLQSLASVQSIQSVGGSTAPQQNWDSHLFAAARTNSVNSVANTFQQPEVRPPTNGPTLPPHPKQKQLPMNGLLPPTFPGGPDRLNSLRGISTLSRGLSGLTRGASIESNASAVLMRNSWEDKFFSMLMLGESEQNAAAAANGALLGPTPIAPGATPSNNMSMGMGHHSGGPVTVSNGSMSQHFGEGTENEDLSDVSETGLR